MRILLLLVVSSICVQAQSERPASKSVWDHLRETYDTDADGAVTKAEYQRGDRAFKNLDRNKDGRISAADFERSNGGMAKGKKRSPREEAAHRLGDLYGSFINQDGQPGISQADWSRLIKILEPREGIVPSEHLNKILGRSAGAPMAQMGMRRLKGLLDQNDDGKVEAADLHALFKFLDVDGNGVIEQGKEIELPPGIGEPAPDFTLPRLGAGKVHVQLSSFAGKKPVVLIFGSYT